VLNAGAGHRRRVSSPSTVTVTAASSGIAEESSAAATEDSSYEEEETGVKLDAKAVSEARKRLLLREEEQSLPPLLRNMVAERRSFELNLGHAMDTLRKDYPEMLRREPNYDIYSEDISVVDPSGVQIRGLAGYKSSFKFLHSFLRLVYHADKSTVQHRMVYDWARSSIRMSWNAELVSKVSIGNDKNALFIDGISVYKLDAVSGKIIEHKVEKLMINNIPLQPPYGIFAALTGGEMLGNQGRIPVGVGAMCN
jgi:hypothetical protein